MSASHTRSIVYCMLGGGVIKKRQFLPQIKEADPIDNYRVRPEPATFLKVLDEEGGRE
ncbi:hypothetical protein [Microscilla marina]|nr:hypothetical protein [Microscilla marina]